MFRASPRTPAAPLFPPTAGGWTAAVRCAPQEARPLHVRNRSALGSCPLWSGEGSGARCSRTSPELRTRLLRRRSPAREESPNPQTTSRLRCRGQPRPRQYGNCRRCPSTSRFTTWTLLWRPPSQALSRPCVGQRARCQRMQRRPRPSCPPRSQRRRSWKGGWSPSATASLGVTDVIGS